MTPICWRCGADDPDYYTPDFKPVCGDCIDPDEGTA